MSESLSQQDIDALFSSEGSAEPSESESPSAAMEAATHDLQLYDFGRPARISKDQKRSLVAIYDVLCKSLEGWLTARCRDRVEMEVESVEVLSFGEFTLALRSPCVSYLADLKGGGGGQAVLDFGHELAFYVVDRFLGGSHEVTVPERAPTQLERLVVRIGAERVAHLLNEAWQDYVELGMKIAGYESIPEMIQACNREDPVLVAHIRTLTGDVKSTLLVSLPFTRLEKFFAGDSHTRLRHAPAEPEEQARNRAELQRSVLDAEVDLAARLPSFPVSVRALAALAEGQVLETGIHPESPVTLRAHEQDRFLGVAGKHGLRLGVRVTDILTLEPVVSG